MNEELSETAFSEWNPWPRWPALLAGITLFLLLSSSSAYAQSETQLETYEIYMTAARKLYAAGQYRDAVEQFSKAFAAFPDPKIYFNLAQSHRMLDENGKALEYYEKFLAAIPGIAEFSPRQKKDFTREVQLKIQEIKDRQTFASQPKPGVDVRSVDDGPMDGARPVDPPVVTPGLTSRWWFWTGVGATALLTAGTAWAGLRTLSFNDRWEETRSTADRDSAMRYQDLTDLCLTGALASAVAVTVASVIWKRRAPARPKGTVSQVSLVPGHGARGWLLNLSWDF